MRTELRRLHVNNDSTTVYVTHDQVEAMAMADRIAIMNDGVLQQVGSPSEVYQYPANLFVAQFVGGAMTRSCASPVSCTTGGPSTGVATTGWRSGFAPRACWSPVRPPTATSQS